MQKIITSKKLLIATSSLTVLLSQVPNVQAQSKDTILTQINGLKKIGFDPLAVAAEKVAATIGKTYNVSMLSRVSGDDDENDDNNADDNGVAADEWDDEDYTSPSSFKPANEAALQTNGIATVVVKEKEETVASKVEETVASVDTSKVPTPAPVSEEAGKEASPLPPAASGPPMPPAEGPPMPPADGPPSPPGGSVQVGTVQIWNKGIEQVRQHEKPSQQFLNLLFPLSGRQEEKKPTLPELAGKLEKGLEKKISKEGAQQIEATKISTEDAQKLKNLLFPIPISFKMWEGVIRRIDIGEELSDKFVSEGIPKLEQYLEQPIKNMSASHLAAMLTAALENNISEISAQKLKDYLEKEADDDGDDDEDTSWLDDLSDTSVPAPTKNVAPAANYQPVNPTPPAVDANKMVANHQEVADSPNSLGKHLSAPSSPSVVKVQSTTGKSPRILKPGVDAKNAREKELQDLGKTGKISSIRTGDTGAMIAALHGGNAKVPNSVAAQRRVNSMSGSALPMAHKRVLTEQDKKGLNTDAFVAITKVLNKTEGNWDKNDILERIYLDTPLTRILESYDEAAAISALKAVNENNKDKKPEAKIKSEARIKFLVQFFAPAVDKVIVDEKAYLAEVDRATAAHEEVISRPIFMWQLACERAASTGSPLPPKPVINEKKKTKVYTDLKEYKEHLDEGLIAMLKAAKAKEDAKILEKENAKALNKAVAKGLNPVDAEESLVKKEKNQVTNTLLKIRELNAEEMTEFVKSPEVQALSSLITSYMEAKNNGNLLDEDSFIEQGLQIMADTRQANATEALARQKFAKVRAQAIADGATPPDEATFIAEYIATRTAKWAQQLANRSSEVLSLSMDSDSEVATDAENISSSIESQETETTNPGASSERGIIASNEDNSTEEVSEKSNAGSDEARSQARENSSPINKTDKKTTVPGLSVTESTETLAAHQESLAAAAKVIETQAIKEKIRGQIIADPDKVKEATEQLKAKGITFNSEELAGISMAADDVLVNKMSQEDQAHLYLVAQSTLTTEEHEKKILEFNSVKDYVKAQGAAAQVASGLIDKVISNRVGNFAITIDKIAVAAGDDDATLKKGLWISGLYGVTQQGAQKAIAGYKSNLKGATIGFDVETSEGNILGIAYSNVRSNLKYLNRRGKDRILTTSHIISLYAQTRIDNFLLQGSLSGAQVQLINKANRLVRKNTYRLATGKLKTYNYNAAASASYKFDLAQGVELLPNIGIRYGKYMGGSYIETGVGVNNLSVAGGANNNVTAIAGIKLLTVRQLSNNIQIVPSIQGTIENYLINKQGKVRTRLKWANKAFDNTIVSPKLAKIGYDLEGALMAVHKNFEVGARVNGNWRKNQQNYQGSFRIKILF